ncbi:MAG: type II toxin-antitoxin system VapC family toxin [Candidatus Entotheonellia bacterium]
MDSSVAIKWFVVEPYSVEAHHILAAYQTGTLTLLALDLLYAEVGDIVWKKHRFQGIAAEDAEEILAAFRLVTFVVTSCAALLEEAYRLAVTHQRTVYDAMYLALSLREHCPWVTADERIANALRATFPQIIWVANWPQRTTLA